MSLNVEKFSYLPENKEVDMSFSKIQNQTSA